MIGRLQQYYIDDLVFMKEVERGHASSSSSSKASNRTRYSALSVFHNNNVCLMEAGPLCSLTLTVNRCSSTTFHVFIIRPRLQYAFGRLAADVASPVGPQPTNRHRLRLRSARRFLGAASQVWSAPEERQPSRAGREQGCRRQGYTWVRARCTMRCTMYDGLQDATCAAKICSASASTCHGVLLCVKMCLAEMASECACGSPFPSRNKCK